jgi:hypothetical protein
MTCRHFAGDYLGYSQLTIKMAHTDWTNCYNVRVGMRGNARVSRREKAVNVGLFREKAYICQ